MTLFFHGISETVANTTLKLGVVKGESRAALPDADGLSDNDLMLRYRDMGNDSDFGILMGRYEREIYRYLVRYLGNASLADDVFQDTFLQIHQKRHLYEEGRPVKPWIYAIANHQAIDSLRRVGRHPTQSLSAQGVDADGEPQRNGLEALLTSRDIDPLASIQTEERRAWVKKSIDSLPEQLRETLVLAYYQDLKYREIADILNVPVGTVKSRLHSALSKIAEKARIDHMSNEDED